MNEVVINVLINVYPSVFKMQIMALFVIFLLMTAVFWSQPETSIQCRIKGYYGCCSTQARSFWGSQLVGVENCNTDWFTLRFMIVLGLGSVLPGEAKKQLTS